MSQSHVQEHIDLIAKHEQDFLIRRTPAERFGDSIAGFAGSLPFVCIHLAIFAGWMVFNSISLTHLHHFDPPPFSLLGTIVALEAILLASIILMRQSRMSRRAEERDHLMLQVLLLTEKEIADYLDEVAGVIEACTRVMPAHERFIADNCAAAALPVPAAAGGAA